VLAARVLHGVQVSCLQPTFGSEYTEAPGNWAPASRPVRAVGGVYTGRRCDVVPESKERRMVTGDLLSRARAGDGEAFRELAESHRRELQVHCYRMLGSFADAEDAVQETMLAAWQGIGGFTEERASLRTWLYKIATNRCLNARRAASRRPAREWDMSQFEPPVPTPRDEPVWLQPFPDALLEGVVDRPIGPEARYEQTEAISLAFVTALQLLPPRQVAVLILRDVLGFHASEVAEMLEVTVGSVNSALKRARASLQRRQQPAAGRQPPPAAGSPPEDVIVARLARAWESADLDALVALLTDDVFIAMPPEPFGYEGRDLVARYWARQFGAGRRFDLVPTRANGQPAFGAYLRVAAGIRHATGFYVLTLAGNRICAMTRFDNSVLPWFGLPRSLPSR
jgi:RNA polymerase sigma-70 factor (TIGR02960 family)